MEATFTVLVVDDEPTIRLAAEKTLARAGYEVLTAESGEAGLAALRARACDLLLLDLMMPGIGGMEVLERVSGIYPELVVIVITGYPTLEDAVGAMKLGAHDFIAKPFDADQLRIVVDRAADTLRMKREWRRLQEEQVRNLRAIDLEKTRTRTIVQSMTEGVLLIGCDGSIVLGNPAAQRVLALEAPAGSDVAAAIRDPGLRDLVLSVCTCRDRAAVDEVRARELRLEDGTWLLATVSPAIAGENGEPGALVVLSDITAQKDLVEAKSEFVATVSHELRSPLAAINQQLAAAIAGLGGEAHEEPRRRLERARERVRGLMDMIADLLDLSRVELGVTARSWVELDAAELVRRTTELVAARLAERRLRLALDVGDGAPLVICTDPDGLQRVCDNLLSNAIKYTPPGGEVAVALGVEAGAMVLRVGDTGIGIAAEDLPRIFERFYRVASPETRHAVGSGLGLPIVKGIVEALGGTVEVASEPGAGSTFTVRLPLDRSSRQRCDGAARISVRDPRAAP